MRQEFRRERIFHALLVDLDDTNILQDYSLLASSIRFFVTQDGQIKEVTLAPALDHAFTTATAPMFFGRLLQGLMHNPATALPPLLPYTWPLSSWETPGGFSQALTFTHQVKK